MFTQYLEREDTIDFSGPVTSKKKLKSGVYVINEQTDGTLYLSKKTIQTEELVRLPNSIADKINQSVDAFLTSEIRVAFDKYGILYKRGLLMYGEPGTGKSTILNQIMATAHKKDMITLFNPAPAWVPQIIENVREVEETERPFMIIWEEFEDWCHRSETELLSLLDGINQISNIFFVATTNYLNSIPPRIRNRPSRFADIIEVGALTKEARKTYLTAKIHAEDKINIDEWVEKTEGKTIDHLKDLIISVLVLKIPLKQAIEKLDSMGSEEDR